MSIFLALIIVALDFTSTLQCTRCWVTSQLFELFISVRMRGGWGCEEWFLLHYTNTLQQSLTNDVLGGEQGLKLSDTMEHLGHTAV